MTVYDKYNTIHDGALIVRDGIIVKIGAYGSKKAPWLPSSKTFLKLLKLDGGI